MKLCCYLLVFDTYLDLKLKSPNLQKGPSRSVQILKTVQSELIQFVGGSLYLLCLIISAMSKIIISGSTSDECQYMFRSDALFILNVFCMKYNYDIIFNTH